MEEDSTTRSTLLKENPSLTNQPPHADRPSPLSPPSDRRRKMPLKSDPSFSSFSTAVDSVNASLSILCSDNHPYSSDVPRRFSDFASRLRAAAAHLLRRELAPAPAVHTAIRGVAADLAAAAEAAAFFRDRSRILVLANCVPLCSVIRERTLSISRWLSLLESAVAAESSDIRKKIADLASDMKQADFKVTENEERVYCTLQKEGEGRHANTTSKAVQSAIVMDLARALGTDPENHAVLAEQIKLLKDDITQSRSVSERRILMSLERIVNSWAAEPTVVTWKLDIEFEDEAHISPFKNFLCPLTKEVMRDPVVLEESSQTYERTAIEYWFGRCLEDGRDATCPVTGKVLASLQVRPNIGLAGAIEEWLNRNVDILARIAVQHLGEEPPVVDVAERVLGNVYKVSEEHPVSRHKFRSSGIVVLIVKLLRNSSKIIGTNLRSKCLQALISLSKDEESKKIMIEEGAIRLGIHSLIASSEKEREYAVKLLLEFSREEVYCNRIASVKGALVLLSSMAGDLEHPTLANLAEEVLKRMEMVKDNVLQLAVSGRFEPLLYRLCEGPDDIKIEMATILGKMTLTNNGKEQLARKSAQPLAEMLSKPSAQVPSLQALYNLSGLDDNATILVDSDVLPALTNILFGNQDSSSESKELAAATMANIVSKPGHWELASADDDGNSMQSEVIVHNLLALLPEASPRCQASVLHILCGIASSPQASEQVASHISSGDGVKTILPFLEHSEAENRKYAFRLTRVISRRLGQDLVHELRSSNKLTLFKDKLLDNQFKDSERSDAACILANMSLSADEVKTLLGADFVKWTVDTLESQRRYSTDRIAEPMASMREGLLGILLHFTKSIDPLTLQIVRTNRLMTIFSDQLGYASKPRVKRLAAQGLKNLSECGRSLAAQDSEPQPPQGLCSPLVFLCRRAPSRPPMCPIHNAPCEEDSQFCLLKSNCIKPLIDLLADDDTKLQIAAIEALSTIVIDNSNGFKRAAEELEHVGAIDAVVDLFIQVRPGELQEKALWIIDRVLRVESQNVRLSLNTSLIRALVEALRNGNANARRYAQEALTNLKQLSGVSGRPSSQVRSRR